MTASCLLHRLLRIGLLPLAFTLALGCGSSSQTRYLHPNADLASFQKVGVLPFDSVLTDRSAAEKVQKIFYLELLALDVFQVAEPGDVARTTRGLQLDTLGAADYQRLGKELGVDAFFTGSVVDFDEIRAAASTSPQVTIQLRLIETSSGATVWSTGQSRSGVAMSTRLFGVGGDSLTDAARKIIRSQLRTLLK